MWGINSIPKYKTQLYSKLIIVLGIENKNEGGMIKFKAKQK
jgi:hypothetical protein